MYKPYCRMTLWIFPDPFGELFFDKKKEASFFFFLTIMKMLRRSQSIVVWLVEDFVISGHNHPMWSDGNTKAVNLTSAFCDVAKGEKRENAIMLIITWVPNLMNKLFSPGLANIYNGHLPLCLRDCGTIFTLHSAMALLKPDCFLLQCSWK